ncbi:replication factor C subunit 2 [Ascoidea rubescens DSM 1968]|uniref:Replication factor C subunit 2 n=1 Tax=Ascoidea rubescens DSM 1968 TaxID=1344418 RepID=A0A1D2V9N0_9ASCO|nr:replication factor C, subunit RFC4 [Ascoidea rubescens DSM 1968]ODV58279.1 replication factor C, subunit RFC4 [Ascoidea rubescens DSM 1968]
MTASFFQASSRKLKPSPTDNIENIPWVEKYRPKNLNDIASQDHAIKVLKKSLLSANLPHMLFYGPPGTGKTSTILALAKELYGPNLIKSRVLELNASDERGISIVRNKVKTFSRLMVSNPTADDLKNYPCPPYKIIILDEADSMTSDAQSALRRTMETYSNVTRFCLICNYITRIIDPLASRCSKFRFKSLDNANAITRLTYIVENEKILLKDNQAVLNEILSISNGDLRKAITFLQSATKLHSQFSKIQKKNNISISNIDLDGDVELIEIDKVENNSSSYDKENDIDDDGDDDLNSPEITLKSVREIAGIIPDKLLKNLIATAETKEFHQIFGAVNNLISDGWSGSQIVDQLHSMLILDDLLTSFQKNQLALILLDADKKLTNGGDEQLQLLNLVCKMSQIL